MKRKIIVDNDVAYIHLTKGYAATIDTADISLVDGYDWTALTRRHKVYAARNAKINGKWQLLLMHRAILGLTDTSVHADHRDGNGLNNRRSNLRPCSNIENSRNRGANINNSSGFKGVSWMKHRNKWNAQIQVNGRRKSLGYFDTAEMAHAAYCAAAPVMHGEFARTE